MKAFILSLISATLAFSYYLILYVNPSLLSDNTAIFGVLVAFIGLHIALRHFIDRHLTHVFLLAISAGLFTFYRSFNDGNLFLFALVALHGIVMLIVILTIPLGRERE